LANHFNGQEMMKSKMKDYLRNVAASPMGAAVKSRAIQLLDLTTGERVVDVGCGPGVDTVSMARLVGPTGRVIGLDSDPEMVREADAFAKEQGVASWTQHYVASATSLPISNEGTDAWHSERLLQHLPGDQPLKSLTEAARVLKRGGRLVVVDTDWGSLSIASRYIHIERRLVGFHARRFASGYVGRVLPFLVRQAGLSRTHSECFSVVLTPENLDFVFNPTEQAALASGLLTQLEWRQWRADLARLRATGDGQATVTATLVAAKRP
jgi:ubiquinone/menaquinone biosynthesis C-methylase UbiE